MENKITRQSTNLAVCEVRDATLYSRVGSMQLSPSFFEEARPELMSLAGCKYDASIFVNWKIVVNDHWGLCAVEVEVDQVAAS